MKNFWSHSSIFDFEKQPKNLNFQTFLPLRDPLEATFKETRAPTSRKYIAEQGIVISSLLKTFQTFRSHPSILAIEKLQKNVNFQSFFTSRRTLGGYF